MEQQRNKQIKTTTTTTTTTTTNTTFPIFKVTEFLYLPPSFPTHLPTQCLSPPTSTYVTLPPPSLPSTPLHLPYLIFFLPTIHNIHLRVASILFLTSISTTYPKPVPIYHTFSLPFTFPYSLFFLLYSLSPLSLSFTPSIHSSNLLFYSYLFLSPSLPSSLIYPPIYIHLFARFPS